jgi:hypothetical protein
MKKEEATTRSMSKSPLTDSSNSVRYISRKLMEEADEKE